ncbi:hypothetical protein AB0M39_33420 [Streptomyces sp. NPDC051907]|uniref:hypothetical protein n=1 Tax=Streptomyces sp. NPDC051907 TaxID=3155284 RepID=UPI003433ECEC
MTFGIPGLLTFPEADLFIAGPVVAQLDENGAFSVVLPATDAPDMNPSGWSYSVKENLAGVVGSRTFAMLLPRNVPDVDLADIAPADPTTPNYVPVPGPKGDTGETGKSAYQSAVTVGFIGTEAEWIASLRGPKGDKGDTGATGAASTVPGPKGDTGAIGAAGPAGSSAYAVAVAGGFVGTEAQWLATLVGPKGDTGAQGPKGDPGAGSVNSVNGDLGPDIVLDAADVGAIPVAGKGVANGVASLGADGKVPAAQLSTPTDVVTSVNGESGPAVTLSAADVGAVAMSEKGAVNGVATLDASGDVPVAQIPSLSGTYVAVSTRGAANGVATLDATTRLPIAQVPTALTKNSWTPQALGFQAWSVDPAAVANPAAKAAVVGRTYMCGMNITESTQVNRVVIMARGWGGSTLIPAARFYAGIYNEAGSRVATSGLVSSLPAAGQDTNTAPGAKDNHIGAVPVPLTAAVTLAPGRYWAAFLVSAGSATDFYYMHIQNEAPANPGNFFLGTVFQRHWCIASGQTSLPATVNQSTGEVGLDPAIMALALV